ncbi:UNVERIFIED_CONTAM: Retrovirus-related Pol polyprotein from transposon TNT 1-94 [Sesamum latifolium]|uniref:Retrovirus-related Pol polyprotein from transposon TNT 1-94 n=1 Tax=Sesamum latifolium TaxID=2727402 RepID=A0AAW2XQL7_9LAMI
MDVKTTFLYGELEEEIYMNQPEGFVAHGNERKVCKLVKSLYGLKQAPKQWHEKFDKTILAFGFIVNENDKCIYSLFKNESGISVTQLRYSQIIESLKYLENGTRSDISFSVSKLTRYTSYPDRTYWSVLDRVLRYQKDTVSLAIHYGRFPASLSDSSDAIAKNSGSNGCSGYVFTLGGNVVS